MFSAIKLAAIEVAKDPEVQRATGFSALGGGIAFTFSEMCALVLFVSNMIYVWIKIVQALKRNNPQSVNIQTEETNTK